MSKIERLRSGDPGILFGMDHSPLEISSAEKDGKDGVLVKFSDGTIAGYVVEELLRLRPVREKVEEPPRLP